MEEYDIDRSLDAMPRAAAGLEIRTAGGETLVHDPATGKVHVLNAMGARVLARCTGTTALSSVVEEIVGATGAERGRVAEDVIAVCEAFRSQGLIS